MVDMRSILRKGLMVVLALAAVGYFLVVGWLWVYQDYYMFRGRRAGLTQTPEARQWVYEDIWIDVPGGKTHGWWIPADNARGAALFSHGSGKNISYYLEDAAFYRGLGFSVLLYDYGGYGKSTGEPSEARCYADVRAMWKHLTEVRKVPPNRIILGGNSMGGGVTIDLAAEVTPGAVAVESTFTSIPDVLSDMYPWLPAHLISHIHFRNIDKVSRIQCPVMVVHSTGDAMVPFAQSQKLFSAITAPKKFLQIHGAHRQGKFDSKDLYVPALREFIDAYMR